MSHVVAAQATWTTEGVRSSRVVEVDDSSRIVAVRDWRAGDPEPEPGLLIPGLVNAHTHLELSHLHERVVGGGGLPAWVGKLAIERINASDSERDEAIGGAIRALVDFGTAAVSDLANDVDTATPLVRAGISGVVHRELLTLDAGRVPDRIRQAGEPDREVIGDGARIVVRPSPHALYSTAPTLVRACVYGVRASAGTGRPPASIHAAEDRAEMRFVRDGTGPWATFLDRAGIDWRWWVAPGGTPIEFLDQLGVLGPGLLLVHGVHTSQRDRALVARSGSPLCLCPRSNLHIGGELPDVPALLEAGVRLCLGTDSLASSPDLDVLGEVATLIQAFPEVEPGTWLDMATRGGALALGLGRLGAIEAGRAPGLVLLEGVTELDQLATAPARRRWLVRPGGL